MEISGELALLITDGVFTTFCSVIIVHLILAKRLTSNLFYYSWAIGFLIYGMEIFLRGYGIPYALVDALVFVAFVFFAFGILYLSRMKFMLIELALFSCLSVVFLLLFLAELIPFEYVVTVGGTVVYLFIGLAILHQRIIFGASAERLAVGWLLLYFTNIFLAGMGWVTNAFAVLAKVIILLGLLDYDFIVIAKKAREQLSPPSETVIGFEGGFKILETADDSDVIFREFNWLRKKIVENVRRSSDTVVCVFQDVVPYKELRAIKWINPERVSVLLFSSSAQKVKSEFTVFPMSLAHVGAVLSEKPKEDKSSANGHTVIFFHLSVLIQLYGAEAVYAMLLNKMGYLRENGIKLYAVFQPSTHSDPHIVSLFTTMADEIIKL